METTTRRVNVNSGEKHRVCISSEATTKSASITSYFRLAGGGGFDIPPVLLAGAFNGVSGF